MRVRFPSPAPPFSRCVGPRQTRGGRDHRARHAPGVPCGVRDLRPVVVALVVGALLSACASVDTPTSPPPTVGSPTSRAAPPSAAEVRTRLGGLEIDDDPSPGEPYRRDLYPTWEDIDHDGCDAREQALVAQSTTSAQVSFPGCKVVAGDWVSPYDGFETDSPSDLDADHLVPLENVHESGGWRWDAARRRGVRERSGRPGDGLRQVEPVEGFLHPGRVAATPGELLVHVRQSLDPAQGAVASHCDDQGARRPRTDAGHLPRELRAARRRSHRRHDRARRSSRGHPVRVRWHRGGRGSEDGRRWRHPCRRCHRCGRSRERPRAGSSTAR